MQHRVQKLISATGYCSRRKAEALIEAGRVTVNGRIVLIGESAQTEDEIRIDGKVVSQQSKAYYALHKPSGYETTLKSTKGYKTVAELFPLEGLKPVGRLDFTTTGLLLLTNDGEFANRVTHPRYETKKTYDVTLDKSVSKDHLKKLRSGITLRDGKVQVDGLSQLSSKRLLITLHEGRNKIVKRLCRKLGFTVTKLHRTRVGAVELGRLKPGHFRELTKKEVQSFTT